MIRWDGRALRCCCRFFMLGDLSISWNSGLTSGFWEYLLASVLVGCAYICLGLCTAEITSVLSFSGGSYGISRVALNPFFGFLVGVAEFTSNLVFMMETVYLIGVLVTYITKLSPLLEPVYWAMFFIPAVAVHFCGTKYSWFFIVGICVVTIVLLLLYICASAPAMSFHRYVTQVDNRFFPSGVATFLLILPTASWLYLGTMSIPLACAHTRKATVAVPRGLMITVVTTFLLSLIILTAACSHPPGVTGVAASLDPLSFGYSKAFGITVRKGAIFALPGLVGSAFVYMYSFSNQLRALSESGLAPSFLSSNLSGRRDCTLAALLTGCGVALVIMLVSWFIQPGSVEIIFHAALLGSYLGYLAMFGCFVIFRLRYTRLTRAFINPLGYVSVVYGAVVFSLSIVAVAVFQKDHNTAVGLFCAEALLATLYYFIHAQYTQKYSEEERAVLLILYVIKSNLRKRECTKHERKTHRKSDYSEIKGKENSVSIASKDSTSITLRSGNTMVTSSRSTVTMNKKKPVTHREGNSPRTAVVLPLAASGDVEDQQDVEIGSGRVNRVEANEASNVDAVNVSETKQNDIPREKHTKLVFDEAMQEIQSNDCHDSIQSDSFDKAVEAIRRMSADYSSPIYGINIEDLLSLDQVNQGEEDGLPLPKTPSHFIRMMPVGEHDVVDEVALPTTQTADLEAPT